MIKENVYYVYIYWRLDTNEPFYIGKGCGYRWRRLNRKNKHFNNIVNKHPIVVEIIKNNLTESEAFYWEEEIIRQLVFEYGYSIDIPNNRSKNEKFYHLVNCTWGGEGTSGVDAFENKTEEEMKEIIEKSKETWKKKSTEEKERINKSRGREGRESFWNNNTKTEKELQEIKRKIGEKSKNRKCTEEIRKKLSEMTKGENNPMYGKNPRDYMTEEQIKEYDKKLSERSKQMWINKTEEEMVEFSLITSERQKGINNSNATLFLVFFLDGTSKIMCSHEIYTKEGFLGISYQSFKKYILQDNDNECIIDTTNMIKNGNTKDMIGKLEKWNGVKIARYSEDENNER